MKMKELTVLLVILVCSTFKTSCSQSVHVYLSLGSTNITTNNTEILITFIGEDASGGRPSLTCHTDLTACCRNSDTGGQEGMGEWYYPDGRVVQNNAGSTAAREGFYRVRNAPQVIRLARKENANVPTLRPTGSYCCMIPTTRGEMKFCATLGVSYTKSQTTVLNLTSLPLPTLGVGTTHTSYPGFTRNGGHSRTTLYTTNPSLALSTNTSTTMAPTSTTMATLTNGSTTMALSTNTSATMATLTNGSTTMASSTNTSATMATLTNGSTIMAPSTNTSATRAPTSTTMISFNNTHTIIAPSTYRPTIIAPFANASTTMTSFTNTPATMAPTSTTVVPSTTTTPFTSTSTTMAPSTTTIALFANASTAMTSITNTSITSTHTNSDDDNQLIVGGGIAGVIAIVIITTTIVVTVFLMLKCKKRKRICCPCTSSKDVAISTSAIEESQLYELMTTGHNYEEISKYQIKEEGDYATIRKFFRPHVKNMKHSPEAADSPVKYSTVSSLSLQRTSLYSPPPHSQQFLENNHECIVHHQVMPALNPQTTASGTRNDDEPLYDN